MLTRYNQGYIVYATVRFQSFPIWLSKQKSKAKKAPGKETEKPQTGEIEIEG